MNQLKSSYGSTPSARYCLASDSLTKDVHQLTHTLFHLQLLQFNPWIELSVLLIAGHAVFQQTTRDIRQNTDLALLPPVAEGAVADFLRLSVLNAVTNPALTVRDMSSADPNKRRAYNPYAGSSLEEVFSLIESDVKDFLHSDTPVLVPSSEVAQRLCDTLDWLGPQITARIKAARDIYRGMTAVYRTRQLNPDLPTDDVDFAARVRSHFYESTALYPWHDAPWEQSGGPDVTRSDPLNVITLFPLVPLLQSVSDISVVTTGNGHSTGSMSDFMIWMKRLWQTLSRAFVAITEVADPNHNDKLPVIWPPRFILLGNATMPPDFPIKAPVDLFDPQSPSDMPYVLMSESASVHLASLTSTCKRFTRVVRATSETLFPGAVVDALQKNGHDSTADVQRTKALHDANQKKWVAFDNLTSESRGPRDFIVIKHLTSSLLCTAAAAPRYQSLLRPGRTPLSDFISESQLHSVDSPPALSIVPTRLSSLQPVATEQFASEPMSAIKDNTDVRPAALPVDAEKPVSKSVTISEESNSNMPATQPDSLPNQKALAENLNLPEKQAALSHSAAASTQQEKEVLEEEDIMDVDASPTQPVPTSAQQEIGTSNDLGTDLGPALSPSATGDGDHSPYNSPPTPPIPTLAQRKIGPVLSPDASDDGYYSPCSSPSTSPRPIVEPATPASPKKRNRNQMEVVADDETTSAPKRQKTDTHSQSLRIEVEDPIIDIPVKPTSKLSTESIDEDSEMDNRECSEEVLDAMETETPLVQSTKKQDSLPSTPEKKTVIIIDDDDDDDDDDDHDADVEEEKKEADEEYDNEIDIDESLAILLKPKRTTKTANKSKKKKKIIPPRTISPRSSSPRSPPTSYEQAVAITKAYEKVAKQLGSHGARYNVDAKSLKVPETTKAADKALEKLVVERTTKVVKRGRKR